MAEKPIWKADLDSNSSTALDALGSLRTEGGVVYKYVLASGTLAAGDVVVYSAANTVATTTSAGAAHVAGVVYSGITSGYYGWIVKDGIHTAAKVYGVGGIAVGDPLKTYTSAGKLQKTTTATQDSFAIALAVISTDTTTSVLVRC